MDLNSLVSHKYIGTIIIINMFVNICFFTIKTTAENIVITSHRAIIHLIGNYVDKK